MRVVVGTSEIRRLADSVSKFIPSKSTTPQATALRLRVSGSTLEGYGSGQIMSGAIQISCIPQTPGEVCVSCHDFAKVVKIIPGNQLELSLKASDGKATKLELRSGKSSYNIPVIDAVIPDPDVSGLQEFATFPVPALQQALKGMLFAVAEDDNRYGLNGVKLHRLDGETIRLVGTDGNRLSYQTLSVATQDAKRLGLLPRKLAQFLLTDLSGENVTVRTSEKNIEFVYQGTRLVGRLLEGQFPDYEAVIPKSKSARTVIVAAQTLRESIARVGVVSLSEVSLDLQENEMVLRTRKLDMGEAHEVVDAKLSGTPLKLGVNGEFLKEAISSYADGDITLQFGDTLSPILVTKDGEQSLHVIMPVRLG